MMMGQSQNQNQNRGSSTSTSRLSASAKPFTMNHLTKPQPKSKFSSFDPSLNYSRPINSSVSGLASFSPLNLGQDNLTVSSYDYHKPVPFDHPQEIGPEPYYPQYLSVGFQDHSGFDMGFGSLTISKTSQPIHAPDQLSIGVGDQGKSVENQGSFCWIEVNDDGLSPIEPLPKQGKAFVAGELNSCHEASNTLERSYSNVTEKYNQTTFWGTEQIDAKCLSLPVNKLTPLKVLISSDLHSAATANDVYQTQVLHHKPVVNWNSFTLDGSSSEGSFPHIDSYSVKTTEMAKCAPQVTSANLTDNFSLKHPGAEACDPVENSSSLLDINNGDLDLDSPCWKGTRNSLRSPFGASQPVNSHLGENEVDQTHNRSNATSHMALPYFVEDHFTCKDKVAISKVAVASSSKGSSKVENQVSTFVPSTAAAEYEPSSSLSGVELPTNISKTFEDVPNSSHRSSGIECRLLLNAMSDLSDLLVQNFSNDLDELHHDAVQHIINNLYVCIRNRDAPSYF